MKRLFAIALAALIWAPLPSLAADKGQVTSVMTRQSERLFAVRIISVDGVNQPSARPLIRLNPGKRRLGVIALIERDNAFHLNRRQQPKPQYVEIEVEAGKHYRIGAKVSNADYKDWTAVIEYR